MNRKDMYVGIARTYYGDTKVYPALFVDKQLEKWLCFEFYRCWCEIQLHYKPEKQFSRNWKPLRYLNKERDENP